jgi:hypothetical protein
MNDRARTVTLTEFWKIFLLFAVLLSAALLVPEARQDLLHSRVIYTIWVSLGFLIPAVFLFFFPYGGRRREVYWLLTWSAALLAYLVHFYYTFGVMFHWSLKELYTAQRPIIATSNLIDTVWWTLDVALAWFVADRKWIRVQRVLVHLYVPITFFVSAVVIKHGFVRGLGIAMTIGLVLGILVRFISRHHRMTVPAAEAQGARS